jgi:hypothetical protein
VHQGQRIYRPLGFGSAPLCNLFRNILAEEAAATVVAAWQ